MTVGPAVENLSSLTAPSAAAACQTRGRFLRLLLRLEAWSDARESRRALYRLDGRALADIGLTEMDVWRDGPAASWQRLLTGMHEGQDVQGGFR